jgi:DNA-binding transcriptional ArsR family regulator
LIELVAERLRVIGEPMRIKLLCSLRDSDGGMTVGELVEAVNASQQNVSKHLAVLHQAGVLSRAKEGTRVRYRIVDDSVFTLCDHVCGALRTQVDELDRLLEGATR